MKTANHAVTVRRPGKRACPGSVTRSVPAPSRARAAAARPLTTVRINPVEMGQDAAALLLDLIEEYARHVGHADLIREAVDGLVGEDPGD